MPSSARAISRNRDTTRWCTPWRWYIHIADVERVASNNRVRAFGRREQGRAASWIFLAKPCCLGFFGFFGKMVWPLIIIPQLETRHRRAPSPALRYVVQMLRLDLRVPGVPDTRTESRPNPRRARRRSWRHSSPRHIVRVPTFCLRWLSISHTPRVLTHLAPGRRERRTRSKRITLSL